jgi:DNA polymerase-3 subunit delta'
MNLDIYPWLSEPWNKLQARRSNLPHALLIHGRPGLGKTALATLFGQRLLCEGPANGDLPCGACAACRWFAQGNHPDFRVLEPEALSEPRPTDEPRKRDSETASRQIRIDQVRELQDFLAIGTHRGGARVVVVRPAEAMNVPTANALLKSLEEPPPGTVFMLVSSAPDRLLPTVRSRCQRVGVAPAHDADAIAWLRTRGVVQDAEAALAYAANAPLAALEDAEERAVREAFIGGRLAGGTRDALELADACQGAAPSRVISWLQKWAVDLVLARTAGSVRYHQRHAPALRALAGSLALDRLLRFERSLAAAAAVAQHPLNPRLFLEDVFLRYAQLWEVRSG